MATLFRRTAVHAPVLHAWFDFRNKKDAIRGLFPELDYRDNGAPALLPFAYAAVLGLQQRSLGHLLFGFCKRVQSVGGPPAMGPIDGTIVPCATAGSLPFVPPRPSTCCDGFADTIRRRGSGSDTWTL